MTNFYQPSFQSEFFPPIVKNLLIINVLLFFAQITAGNLFGYDALTLWLALWPLGIDLFYPWQLITYGFLHGGIGHLLMNMLALWMFGSEIERVWGAKRFSFFYFVCIVGAALAQLAVKWASFPGLSDAGLTLALREYAVPMVGASGGVYGILLAFGMLYPRREIYFFLLPIPIEARWLVVGYGALELVNGLLYANSGIAHFAHLGGMFFGLGLMLYWGYKLPFRRSAG